MASVLREQASSSLNLCINWSEYEQIQNLVKFLSTKKSIATKMMVPYCLVSCRCQFNHNSVSNLYNLSFHCKGILLQSL